ncbi:MAG: molybdopterin-binding protein [Methylococcales bacterium]|nr:molybdopterin-binding protein [Methylococcales bacterium]
MNPTVEIFSQGEEVITGQVADTNAAWLSSHLISLGFEVSRHTAVGDNLNDLTVLLQEIASRSACCLCTGGLGPTTDDLTREAVSNAFDTPLIIDPIALENIQTYFQKREKKMAEVNRQQAFFPRGATRIDNPWGTAPAFSFKYEQCLFIFLPGVPFEMRNLFNEKIKAILTTDFTLTPQPLITLKTFGIGESELQSCLNQLDLPKTLKIGFRATPEENQLKLLFPQQFPPATKALLINQITAAIGDPLFAIETLENKTGGLVEVVSKQLQQNKQTLAAIETLSQGLFAAKCIGHTWLTTSSFFNTLESLRRHWKIDLESDLSIFAKQLAKKLQHHNGTDFALVQLYQDDNQVDRNENHPVILYNTLQTPTGIHQRIETLNGSLDRKQNRAAMLGLDLLRRYLQPKKI